MEWVTIVKLEELEDAVVPNNKEVGYMKEGYMIGKPKKGEVFYLYESKLFPKWRTSTVTKIIDNNTFRTLNSIYQIKREKL